MAERRRIDQVGRRIRRVDGKALRGRLHVYKSYILVKIE